MSNDNKPAAAQEAVVTYCGRRLTPEGTRECWGYLSDGVEDLPRGTKLYAAPVAAAPVDDVQLALIGRRHFNGPAPQAWYAAARELLASTPAAPGIDLAPRQMATAPRDGTMVRLLVQFDDHATEDTEGPAWTIGACNDDNVGDDEHVGWQFAGWCWDHDHFTEGKGTPVGWLPLLDASPKGGSTDPTIPEPHQECYSDNDGDSWYDHPADSMLVDGLAVGDTYTLSVSHYSVGRTYRVTKAPDETSDDYEVEPVQVTSADMGVSGE